MGKALRFLIKVQSEVHIGEELSRCAQRGHVGSSVSVTGSGIARAEITVHRIEHFAQLGVLPLANL